MKEKTTSDLPEWVKLVNSFIQDLRKDPKLSPKQWLERVGKDSNKKGGET
jgi:hypothetical protein